MKRCVEIGVFQHFVEIKVHTSRVFKIIINFFNLWGKLRFQNNYSGLKYKFYGNLNKVGSLPVALSKAHTTTKTTNHIDRNFF